MKNRILNIIKNDINIYGTILYIQVSLTNNCQEDCNHCYQKNFKNNLQELSTEDVINIIDQIDNVSKIKKIKPYIAFTGGDPLLHKSLFELIEYSRNKGIEVVIKGNPRLLKKEYITKLSELGIYSYNLSLDGLEKTHDLIRSNGSFNSTIDAIKNLKSAGINVVIKYTVQKSNYGDLIPLMRLCSSLNVDAFDFARYCPDNSADIKDIINSNEYRMLLYNSLKEYQNMLRDNSSMQLLFRDHLWIPFFYELGLLDQHIDEKIYEQDDFVCGCSMGSNGITINYTGEIYPCQKFSDYSLGSIYDKSIDNILDSVKYNQLKKNEFYNECEGCKLINLCRGCPAINKSLVNLSACSEYACWKMKHKVT
ncbi:MAG: radical SAM protein [Paraclostridium sordellii]